MFVFLVVGVRFFGFWLLSGFEPQKKARCVRFFGFWLLSGFEFFGFWLLSGFEPQKKARCVRFFWFLVAFWLCPEKG